MKSYVAIFEIPATDMERAVSFYQEILGITIERMEFPGMEMGLLPYEDQMVTGVIMKGEGYEPSASGVTIYMNAGEDLQVVLDKVETNGERFSCRKPLMPMKVDSLPCYWTRKVIRSACIHLIDCLCGLIPLFWRYEIGLSNL